MTLYMPDNTGGSRIALEYSSAVIRNGGRVWLAYGPTEHAPERCQILLNKMAEAGVQLISAPNLKQPVGTGVVNQLVKVARTNQVDCVIGNNQRDRSTAIAVARKIGVPGIACGLNQHIFHGFGPVGWMKKLFYIYWMRRSSLIVCSSAPVRNELLDMGIDPSRADLLTHGINLAEIPQVADSEKTALRESLGIHSNETMMINIGRLDPQKGQDVLVDAMLRLQELTAKAENAKLVIVGAVGKDSSEAENYLYKSRIEKIVEDSGLSDRVVFTGWRDDFYNLLMAADVYVHSARFEGLPLTVLAAMACRLPVVIPDNASRPPGFEHNQHGLLVAPEDSVELAKGMQRILEMSDYSGFVQQSRSLIEDRYDMATIGDRFVEMVAKML